jgi:hypothetical protein
MRNFAKKFEKKPLKIFGPIPYQDIKTYKIQKHHGIKTEKGLELPRLTVPKDIRKISLKKN